LVKTVVIGRLEKIERYEFIRLMGAEKQKQPHYTELLTNGVANKPCQRSPTTLDIWAILQKRDNSQAVAERGIFFGRGQSLTSSDFKL